MACSCCYITTYKHTALLVLVAAAAVFQARLLCDRPKHDAPPQAGRPYLLHGLRLAVHFRRGDIAENKRWADRMLSTDYFVNVVKQIMQVSLCGAVRNAAHAVRVHVFALHKQHHFMCTMFLPSSCCKCKGQWLVKWQLC
jgi:uncharacterized membrane protein